MRLLTILSVCLMLLAPPGAAPAANEAQVLVRPDVVYVEEIGGNLIQVSRLFFHILVHNVSAKPVEVQWIRFDIVNQIGRAHV